jgi:hypothetical protein
VSLSLGNLEDIETLTGEMVTKTVELVLTIAGEPKGYVMGLRKYDMQGTGVARVVSRWVISSLEEKR